MNNFDLKKYISEDSLNDEGYEYQYYEDGGWNVDKFEESGLLEIIDGFIRMDYELRNTNRGVYGNFGDNIFELKTYLEDVSRGLLSISKEL